ncbi:MAG: flagellar protein FlaG [Lachnospiraceae bacterium]|nr:flagellar protein FlaG [Lachnospiraceae bacterium]
MSSQQQTQPVRKAEPVAVESNAAIPQDSSQQAAINVSARRDNYDQRRDGDENDSYKRDPNKKDEGKELQEVSAEKVKDAISEINKKIAPTQTECSFKYHEKTHRISITVKDKETDKVIREIPPEKTLDMIAKTLELAGILVDEKR